MPTHFTPKLDEIEKIIADGLDAGATVRILEILGGAGVAAQDMEHGFLYSETLPKGREPGFTPMQRHLHFLWDAFDKLPLSLIAPFSIPFRRLLAGHLFEKRGEAFVCEENVRFNFGQFLSIGDNVFINRNVFLDTKGGITIGDSVGVAEDARIFTHGHSESSHMERTYKPVVIEDFAKIYSGVTIFPGVRVGREAIVASGALVTHDVPAGMVVAGMPAQVIRERQSHGRHGDDLDHIWLF